MTKDLASRLNRRVLVEQCCTQDIDGITTERWIPKVTLWCDVEYLSTSEQLHASAVNHPCEVRFTIRYRSDIRADKATVLRLKYNNQIYNISGVRDPDDQRCKLEISATTQPIEVIGNE